MRKFILERGAARSAALSAVALAAALVVASCGGGDADDASADALGASESRSSALGAGSASCDTRVNNTHAKLLECVTLEGVRAHQAALQAIADANGGTRAAGTPGYDASVKYIVDKMTAAGYQRHAECLPVRLHPCRRSCSRSRPNNATYETGAFTGSGYRRRDRGRDRGGHQPRPARVPTPAAARRPTSPASRPATSR